MLLVYPPAARSTEPPLGIARLAGFLNRNGVPTRCLDLCREGLDYLLTLEPDARDTWTRGALRRRSRNRALLGDIAAYATPDRYRRAVLDLIRHPGASAVVPFLDDGRVLLIRQYRHAVGGALYEVAGKLDPGEAPESCARRGLEEETGYRAAHFERLATDLDHAGLHRRADPPVRRARALARAAAARPLCRAGLPSELDCYSASTVGP